MNPVVGWGLALVAVVAGWLGYGWRGLVLAVTVIVFWLLLQFSRSLRALQRAGQRPVGTVANAVMLHANSVAAASARAVVYSFMARGVPRVWWAMWTL